MRRLRQIRTRPRPRRPANPQTLLKMPQRALLLAGLPEGRLQGSQESVRVVGADVCADARAWKGVCCCGSVEEGAGGREGVAEVAI